MVARWVLRGIALLVAAPAIVFAVPQVVGGDAAFVVLSSSMAPTFHAGDFIVTQAFQPGDPVTPGQIVTYRSGQVLVTHRVVEVQGDPGARAFITQGDANKTPDSNAIEESRVIGVYMFHVPFYGRLFAAAATPLGWFAFLAVPLGLWVAMAALKGQRAAAPPLGQAPPQLAARPRTAFQVIATAAPRGPSRARGEPPRPSETGRQRT